MKPALCEAVKVVLAAAHGHIVKQDGNQNEASKKEACWCAFKSMEVQVGQAWRAGLADKPYERPNSLEEALCSEWNRVRHYFISDSRTIGELEAMSGKVWMATRSGDPVYFYAEKTWEQLRTEKLKKSQRLGLITLQGLIELFSAAYEQLNSKG